MKSRIILFASVIFLCMTAAAKAQAPESIDSTKVLFVGNSFTINNNTPNIFKQLCQSAGLPISVSAYTHLGVGVDYFINKDSFWLAVKSKNWDYIVFQDFEAYFYDSLGTFPPNIFQDNLKFQDSIKGFLPCCKIVYVAGWEMQGGIPSRFPGDNTYLLINRLLANYNYLNSQPGVHNILAPVGVAWKQFDLQEPGISLVDADNRHPTIYGSYIYASMIYATILRQDPTNLSYISYADAKYAKIIRKIVWASLLDTITYTNLNSFSIPISRHGSVYVAGSGFSHYQWYKNDKLISGSYYDTLNVKDTTAFYSVSGDNTNSCHFSSFAAYWPMDAHTSGINDLTFADAGLKLYPNPAHRSVTLEYDAISSQDIRLRISAMDGKLMYEAPLKEAMEQTIDLDHFAPGIYIAEVTSQGKTTRQKLVVQ